MSGNYRVCTCTCNDAALMAESLSTAKPIKHQRCKYETRLSLQDEQYMALVIMLYYPGTKSSYT